MNQQTPFRLLLHLFQLRFLENDTVSPGGGFQGNIHQVLGFLVSIGIFLGVFTMPGYLSLSSSAHAPSQLQTLAMLRLLFMSYSFAFAGFASAFEWDAIFPDRRDFLILTALPLGIGELFAAKFTALVRFLLIFVLAINAFPDAVLLLMVLIDPGGWPNNLRLALTHIAATSAAGLFAFLLFANLQGVLMNITSPRIFRRLGPWCQMLGMSLMTMALLTFPFYAMLMPRALAEHQTWIWFFPPVWFTGWFELFSGGRDQTLRSIGVFGLQALGFAVLFFMVTWLAGYRRHYRRTLEAAEALPRIQTRWAVANLIRSRIKKPATRAIFDFSGHTLARSSLHQLFAAAWLSAGISIAVLAIAAIDHGKIILSKDGARAVPFIIQFFIISGFRTVFQFPADLSSNWIFRITEAHSTEAARAAARSRVLITGLLPAVLFFVPFEIALWHWPEAILHAIFQLTSGALLIEVLFLSLDRAPFTCSYFPGNTNLSLLVLMYGYGFTHYSFNLADLELVVEQNTIYTIPFFTASTALLIFFHRRKPVADQLRFDGEDPIIQRLNLT